MDTYHTIISKRDTRAYTDKPVPEETLRRILTAGRMAGSSKNGQPFRFVVLRDREKIKALAACGQFTGAMAAAPLVIAIVLVALLVGAGVYIAGIPPPDIEDPFMCTNSVVGGLHFHPAIRIIVDGSPYPIPEDVGASRCAPANSIGILHTHPGGMDAGEIDAQGFQKIHVEGPSGRTYRLRHFFEVWGLPFSSSVLAGYNTLDGGTLRMTVGGSASPEWENLRLVDGQRIEIAYTS